MKHRPETCEQKSKKGDTLKMHYVGEWRLTAGVSLSQNKPRGVSVDVLEVLGSGLS